MVYGYPSLSTDARNVRAVVIDNSDADMLEATGITKDGAKYVIDLSYGVGGMIAIPSRGEEWLIERMTPQKWGLVSKTRWQDPRAAADSKLKTGDVSLVASGRLSLRDSNGVLVTSPRYFRNIVTNPTVAGTNSWLEVVDESRNYVVGYVPFYANTTAYVPPVTPEPSPTPPGYQD